MIVRFATYRNGSVINCTLNTESGCIHVKETEREYTVPLMRAAVDLRTAAIKAKVSLLRLRAGQFNPLTLQDQNGKDENHSEEAPAIGGCIDSIRLVQPQYATE